MPSFPSSSIPVPGAGYTFTPRTLGGVNLNDRVNTFFDHYDVPGTAFVQAEQLWNRGGQVAIVKTDKKGLIIAVYGLWLDGGGRRWEDFVAQMETMQNVDFELGDGQEYANVYCTDVVGTQVAVLDVGPPALRALKWSLKLTSISTARVPA